jgi:hypothetical protein
MFVWYIPCGVLSIASNFERAQRDCAEVSPQGRATASADHYGLRGCYGGLGGLALQDVEQMDEQGLVCMRLEGNVRTGGNWHVVSHSHL